MHDTVYGDGIQQSLVFPDNHPELELRGQPKGMKIILKERGLWRDKPKPMLKICNAKKGGCPQGSIDCCASAALSAQPDFQAQRGQIEELITRQGHKIIFYPKYKLY